MKDRSFKSFLGNAGTAWGLAPRARQPERMRRIGVLHFSEHDPESTSYIAAFLDQLGELGWTVGKNLQVDYRWTGGLEGRIHQYATDLVALEPDVVLAAGNSHVGPLQQITHTVPIVFVQVADAARRRLRQEPSASRGQRHRLHESQIRQRRKLVGTAQTDRAKSRRGWP